MRILLKYLGTAFIVAAACGSPAVANHHSVGQVVPAVDEVADICSVESQSTTGVYSQFANVRPYGLIWTGGATQPVVYRFGCRAQATSTPGPAINKCMMHVKWMPSASAPAIIARVRLSDNSIFTKTQILSHGLNGKFANGFALQNLTHSGQTYEGDWIFDAGKAGLKGCSLVDFIFRDHAKTAYAGPASDQVTTILVNNGAVPINASALQNCIEPIYLPPKLSISVLQRGRIPHLRKQQWWQLTQVYHHLRC